MLIKIYDETVAACDNGGVPIYTENQTITIRELIGLIDEERRNIGYLMNKDQGIKLKGGVFKTIKRLKPKC